MNNQPQEIGAQLQKYDQLIEGGKGSLGDCFRACMATLLQMPPEGLPNPHKQGVWLMDWEEWLNELGLDIFFYPSWRNGSGYWIASVPSLNYKDNTTHAVVMKGNQLFHDPSPAKKYTLVKHGDVRMSYHIELVNIQLLITTAQNKARLEEVECAYKKNRKSKLAKGK